MPLRKDEKKMTEKQKMFCQEYLVDLNAAQAAIRAGYSSKTRPERIKAKPEVKSYIEKQMEKRARRTGINADRVVEELARIAFVKPAEVVDLRTGRVKEDVSQENMAAINQVKVKETNGEDWDSIEREVKFADKLKALELLGKHCGLWNDKAELNVPVQVVIQYDYGEDADG